MTKKPHVELTQPPVQLDAVAQLAIKSFADELVASLARGTRDITPARGVPARGAAAPSRAPGQRSPGEYAEVKRPAVGDGVETRELYAQVQTALVDKPYTFRDLIVHLGLDASGENRVKSIIVRLQRDGLPVVNLGNGSRAVWWIDTHGRIGALAAERRSRK